MTAQTHIQAHLTSAETPVLTATVPLPLPEAVLRIEPKTPDVKWVPGSMPPGKEFTHQRYYLQSDISPAPTYARIHDELAKHEALKCRDCGETPSAMFARAVPRTIETRIEDIGWTCDACYRKRHG